MESLIPKIGFFCKHCGAFFTFLYVQHKDTVLDEDGWGVSATYVCPLCQNEAEYLSSEATLESAQARKLFGLS